MQSHSQKIAPCKGALNRNFFKFAEKEEVFFPPDIYLYFELEFYYNVLYESFLPNMYKGILRVMR